MLARSLRQLARRFGYEVLKSDHAFAPRDVTILKQVAEFTMTPPSRIIGLVESVRHLVADGVQGDFVECGVWRGGSTMAAALTLMDAGDTSRTLHLFDTFEGMTAPTEKDKASSGKSAADILAETERKEGYSVWAFASLEDVQKNLASTGYPMDRVRFVKGKVEDTIPAGAPEKIAFLRLDTDWYESTKHELEHLYDRLVPHGVLIIDDYGHWAGSRQAVDEYLAKLPPPRPYLARLDYAARVAIKPKP
jgi:hypothetical protein